MFDVSNGSHLSLADVSARRRGGMSVLRSAHIGNLNAQTLFLAGEGFPVILDEYATGTMRAYRPAFIRRDGTEHQVAHDPRLPATHLRARVAQPLQGAGSPGPARYHYTHLKALFPSTIRLTAQLLLEQRQFVCDVLEVLAQRRPESYRKLVDEEGRVFLRARLEPPGRQVYSAADGSERALRVQDLPEMMTRALERAAEIGRRDYTGPALTVDVDTDILLLTVSEVYRGREGEARFRAGGVTTVHFAGLEMMNYLVKSARESAQHREALRGTYELLRHAFPRRLPAHLDVQLVPTDMIAKYLVTTPEGRRVVDDALSLQDGMLALDAARRSLWGMHSQRVARHPDGGSHADLAAVVKALDPEKLPRNFARQVRRAQDMLDRDAPDRGLLESIATKTAMATEGTYPDFAELDGQAQSLRRALAAVHVPAAADVTQYDVEAGTQLLFPERARLLSQEELRLRWKRMPRA